MTIVRSGLIELVNKSLDKIPLRHSVGLTPTSKLWINVNYLYHSKGEKIFLLKFMRR